MKNGHKQRARRAYYVAGLCVMWEFKTIEGKDGQFLVEPHQRVLVGPNGYKRVLPRKKGVTS